MTVESILTRQLNIRFIDARSLCNEAKLNLGIEGYYEEGQEDELIHEAIQIFSKRPTELKQTMRQLKCDLDAVKIPKGSMSNRSTSDEISVSCCSSDDGFAIDTNSQAADGLSSSKNYKFNMFSVRRR